MYIDIRENKVGMTVLCEEGQQSPISLKEDLSMLSPENMNEKEQLHYDGSMVLLVLFGIWILGSILVLFLSLISICVHPASQTVVADTGAGLRFDLLIGYAQLSAQHLPADYAQVNGKLFAVSYLLLLLFVDKLPVLVIWRYANKMMKTLGKAHSPFVPEIADCVVWIGRVILAMGFFQKLVMQAGISLIVYHKLYFNNPIELVWVFVGLIILLIGDIFKRGCVLQQDADETL